MEITILTVRIIYYLLIVLLISVSLFGVGYFLFVMWKLGDLHIGKIDTDSWDYVDYKWWYYTIIKEMTPFSERELFIKLITTKFWGGW